MQDTNLTWHNENPELTTCFKKSVLIWIPCLFLWILLPFEIRNMKKSQERDIPLTLFNINKLVKIYFILKKQINSFISKKHY